MPKARTSKSTSKAATHKSSASEAGAQEKVASKKSRSNIKYESEDDEDFEEDRRNSSSSSSNGAEANKDDIAEEKDVAPKRKADSADETDVVPKKKPVCTFELDVSDSSNSDHSDDEDLRHSKIAFKARTAIKSQGNLASAVTVVTAGNSAARVSSNAKEIHFTPYHQTFGLFFDKRGNLRTVDGIDAKPIDVYDWPGVNSRGQPCLVQVWRNNAAPFAKFIE